MTQIEEFLMKTTLAAALVSVLASAANAQVPDAPTRPGLNIGQSTGNSGRQTGNSGQQPRTTDLVQRQPGAGQPGGRAPTTAPSSGGQQGSGEFFYVEEGAQGPQELSEGLSDFNSGRMTQAGQQLRGNYGPMSRRSMPTGMTQEAWDRPFENMSQGQSAPGHVRFQWSSDMVMPVRMRQGMVTNIVLPEWEAVEDVVIGDGSAVEAKIMRPNQVAVRTTQTGVDTSMSVVGGSNNVYTFYLRTEGRNTGRITDLQVFVQAEPSKGSEGWFDGEKIGAYSETLALASAGNTEGDADAGDQDDNITLDGNVSHGGEPVPVDRRIFNLKMYEVNEGDRAIAPEYAYTDGRFTYLHFPAGMTDLPAVFRVVDEVSGRVNTRIAGRHNEIVIIEALGDFILRSGTRAVCIVEVDDPDR